MLLASALLQASPTPPSASARVVVQAQACEGLDDAEVGRLLDIELTTVTAEIREGPPLEVSLQCEGSRLTITVIDPLTRKRLARDIPAPASEPGRERVVALAISQLFAASWLELLTAEEPPPPPPDAPDETPDTEAVEAARRVAESATGSDAEPPPSPPRPGIELMVGAGARGRALENIARLPAVRTELRLRSWLRPGIGIVAFVGWDFAQDTRRNGRLRGQAATAGTGLAWAYRPDAIGIGGALTVAGGWARVRGLPSDPNIQSGARDDLTAEAGIGIGPRIRYGRLRFDLDAELGAMLRSPVGEVTGEVPMSMGGLWAGAVLRLGGALR